MSIHSFALQQSIYSTLSSGNITDNSGSSVPIYDDVPELSPLPYVRIGEEQTSNAGTKTKDANEHILTLDIWSEYRGRKEIKQIMSQVYNLLHDSAITISGASLVNLRCEVQQTLEEADGITRHGVMRFRALVFDN
tara:strand:- start:1620 stop:2027 length:408 start_codon:yes stop_codon:yes gene_type:complete